MCSLSILECDRLVRESLVKDMRWLSLMRFRVTSLFDTNVEESLRVRYVSVS